MFFSAALLVTFVTVTASALRALYYVRYVASCTDRDSRCLDDVVRWLYKNLLQGLFQWAPLDSVVCTKSSGVALDGPCRPAPRVAGRKRKTYSLRWPENIQEQ